MKRSGAFDKLKVILVSHTHHDHVEDVPYILSRVQKASSRPLVAGDKNLVGVLKAYRNREKEMPWLKGIEALRSGPQKIFDFNEKKMQNPLPKQRLGLPVGTFGKFTITAYISQHGLYDALPFNLEGDVSGKAPLTGLQYKAYLNSSMTYLIEYNAGSDLPGGPNRTFRIFASDSARFLNNERVSAEVAEGGPVDILLEGIASRIKDNKIPQRIDGFKPRYFIPTHYDNFFKPMDQFQIFDFMIMDPIIAPNDNSRLSEFIRTFGQDIHVPPPKLRMLKMSYYYSLQNLLTNPR